jgi:hypothetical protein
MGFRYYAIALLTTLCAGDVFSATIYECRAYNGSTFFSSGLCVHHQAAGVAAHSVPNGMPFEQQVKLVEDAKNRKTASTRADDDRRVRSGQCATIDDELKVLEKKYTNWQYVPIEEVNVDQARQRDLKAKRSQLQCYSR